MYEINSQKPAIDRLIVLEREKNEEMNKMKGLFRFGMYDLDRRIACSDTTIQSWELGSYCAYHSGGPSLDLAQFVSDKKRMIHSLSLFRRTTLDSICRPFSLSNNKWFALTLNIYDQSCLLCL